MNQLIHTMIEKATKTLDYAYAPYSNFIVSSCLCSESDTLYTGVNVENSSFGLTVCAETSAICQMIAAGEQKIKRMVILAKDNKLCPPCGGCCQRIYEFSSAKTEIYLCNHKEILKKLSISELLPLAFTLKSRYGS